MGFAWVYAYISKGVFCLYDLRYDWRGPLGFSICGLTDLFVCLSFFFNSFFAGVVDLYLFDIEIYAI